MKIKTIYLLLISSFLLGNSPILSATCGCDDKPLLPQEDETSDSSLKTANSSARATEAKKSAEDKNVFTNVLDSFETLRKSKVCNQFTGACSQLYQYISQNIESYPYSQRVKKKLIQGGFLGALLGEAYMAQFAENSRLAAWMTVVPPTIAAVFVGDLFKNSSEEEKPKED